MTSAIQKIWILVNFLSLPELEEFFEAAIRMPHHRRRQLQRNHHRIQYRPLCLMLMRSLWTRIDSELDAERKKMRYKSHQMTGFKLMIFYDFLQEESF